MCINLAAISKALEQKGPVILLESQSRDHPWSRRSYVAARPTAEIRAYGREIHITGKEGRQHFEANPWEALRAFREQYDGWLFGYLGYDLKNHTELLSSQNPDAIGAPDLYFMVPGFILEQDRHTLQVRMIRGSIPPNDERHAFSGSRGRFKVRDLKPQLSMDDYLGGIREAQRAIADGDFYEINLSHQLRGKFSGSSMALYQSMKKVGPVPFGAYLRTPDCTICCQSPERFLRKEAGTVFSQPIKGTSQRGKDEQEDHLLKEALSSSVKERAENLMIVDLVRNDLSRIAEKGSVTVTGLFDIETFGTVHQMVSTIQAEAGDKDPVCILQSCFPMGSMTGAPKISVMEAIERIEKYRRGIYSGAIGYIKPAGDFDFNVVIRTAIIKDNELFYAVGGAITGDSNPEAEWQETMVKAQALKDAT
ncbi:para-aminobenzoate synthetase component 1 [Fodinibius roseus]|uniref:aminodeoxychorismate synthase n=1 Tax=Fodinibius roseus TaxID=1194090 RepID=A0A1M4TLH8_9BACT|nr:aminodeoxychorismate synthase component I [Fodinibius roseus]SHE45349.1 para-aminobenzoate synthetase component 1 [Fodinibius roseus]